MKRAALYARVSTDAQLDNSSLDAQIRRSAEYCQGKGYSIIIEKVESMSGSFVLARSGFSDLLEMAADGDLDVIVVDIPDRLGRGDAIAKLELLAQLNGSEIEYSSPGRDTSTIEGLALKATDQLVSGIERMNIRRRTMGGKRAWAEKGRVIASSFSPYGYRFESKYDEHGHKVSCRMEIVEEEAKTVRTIFDLCANEQMTTHAVCRWLNREKVPTPRPASRVRRLHGLWRSATVYRMLKNRTYMGEWQFGKRLVERKDTAEGIRRHYIEHNRADAITVKVPAIVDAVTWHAAQEQISQNTQKFRKPLKHPYILRGRVHCAACGSSYRGSGGGERKSGKYYRYYRCRQNHKEYGQYQCSSGPVKTEVLDAVVWEVVKEAMQDENRLFAGLESMRQEAARARRNIEGLLVATDCQIQKAKAKLERYLDLYGSGDMEKDQYKAKKEAVDAEIKQAQKERAEIEHRLSDCQILDPAQEKELRKMRAEIAKHLEWGTPEKQMRLFEMLRLECYYNDAEKSITVTGLIGKHVSTLQHTCSWQNGPRVAILARRDSLACGTRGKD